MHICLISLIFFILLFKPLLLICLIIFSFLCGFQSVFSLDTFSNYFGFSSLKILVFFLSISLSQIFWKHTICCRKKLSLCFVRCTTIYTVIFALDTRFDTLPKFRLYSLTVVVYSQHRIQQIFRVISGLVIEFEWCADGIDGIRTSAHFHIKLLCHHTDNYTVRSIACNANEINKQ